MPYDAVLVVSFGGPEKREDVVPFLDNVLRGRNVPRERLLEVAEHYYLFGGKSPINSQNRALVSALKRELAAHGPNLPVYWGNRNWDPLLADTLRQMRHDGVQHALAFVTSAYSSYSGCRQYREDIERAQAVVGDGAPRVDKLRVFFNNSGFIEAIVDNARAALKRVPPDAALVYTAHSIPLYMAQTSRYEAQLSETCRLVSAGLGRPDSALVFQSRSGPPSQPWLEPDIGAYIRSMEKKNLVIVPIGFISDHMEVVYDLDTEARQLCEERGVTMVRAATPGTHPKFVRMIRELIVERMENPIPRAYDVCAPDCCPAPPR